MLKKGIKKFIAFFLTATFLVSGNGIVFAIHTCLTTSTKKISLFSEISCCSKKESGCHPKCNGETKLDSDCCSSEFSYHKLSSPFSVNKSTQLPAVDFFFSDPFESKHRSSKPWTITGILRSFSRRLRDWNWLWPRVHWNVAGYAIREASSLFSRRCGGSQRDCALQPARVKRTGFHGQLRKDGSGTV